jgi:predicted outer membrane repeat protein
VGSSVRLSSIVVAVALAGAALMAAAPAAQAAAGRAAAVEVACTTDALVSAINTANSGLGATLLLPAGCAYNITSPVTAADGLPIITEPVALVGGGSTVIGRSPAALTAFRVFQVAAGGTLSLTGITVRDGSTTGLGGGILNAGTVHLTGVVFSGNKAGNGGALSNSTGATADIYNALFEGNTTTGVGGGGILNSGILTVHGGVFSGNTAPVNGGAVNTQPRGTSRLNQSTFDGNVSRGLGGAMSNLGTTSLNGTVVRMNTGSSGGGIATGNANVTLQNSYVSDNTPDNCYPLNTIAGCVN